MKDKTQKRQRIMDAALQVFVKSGYEKTKIIDVAQAAGIGKGTVYEYTSYSSPAGCSSSRGVATAPLLVKR